MVPPRVPSAVFGASGPGRFPPPPPTPSRVHPPPSPPAAAQLRRAGTGFCVKIEGRHAAWALCIDHAAGPPLGLNLSCWPAFYTLQGSKPLGPGRLGRSRPALLTKFFFPSFAPMTPSTPPAQRSFAVFPYLIPSIPVSIRQSGSPSTKVFFLPMTAGCSPPPRIVSFMPTRGGETERPSLPGRQIILARVSPLVARSQFQGEHWLRQADCPFHFKTGGRGGWGDCTHTTPN